jgi:hypothetical protein
MPEGTKVGNVIPSPKRNTESLEELIALSSEGLGLGGLVQMLGR